MSVSRIPIPALFVTGDFCVVSTTSSGGSGVETVGGVSLKLPDSKVFFISDKTMLTLWGRILYKSWQN